MPDFKKAWPQRPPDLITIQHNTNMPPISVQTFLGAFVRALNASRRMANPIVKFKAFHMLIHVVTTYPNNPTYMAEKRLHPKSVSPRFFSHQLDVCCVSISLINSSIHMWICQRGKAHKMGIKNLRKN